MNNKFRSARAATAVVFCGYLTVATSAPERKPCPESHLVGHVSAQIEAPGEATSWWQTSGFTSTPIVEWQLAITPEASIVYVPQAGQPQIPIFQVEQPSTTSPSYDAGLVAKSGSDADVTSSLPVQLDNFVEEFRGGLRVVCAVGAAWCRDLHIAVTLPDTSQGHFNLTATAFSAGCGANGPVTELTLMPWQP